MRTAGQFGEAQESAQFRQRVRFPQKIFHTEGSQL